MQASSTGRSREVSGSGVMKLENRFDVLNEENFSESIDENESYLMIGNKNLFCCQKEQTKQRKTKKIKTETNPKKNLKAERYCQKKFEKLNLFSALREYPEEDITKVLKICEVSRIPKKSLQKCKRCNCKRRTCVVDSSNCKAAQMLCKVCKKSGHFPKSRYCKAKKKAKLASIPPIDNKTPVKKNGPGYSMETRCITSCD